MAVVGALLCFLLFSTALGQEKNSGNVNNGKQINWEEHKSDYWVVYENDSIQYPDSTFRESLDFKLKHPKPIGLLVYGNGAPIEIRDQANINADIFSTEYYNEVQSHMDGSILPLRNMLPKGFGVWGYFEVTHDVSKYTLADVFNGIGKKTATLARFSVTGIDEIDTRRDIKGASFKLYTNDGILDFLCAISPVFALKEPTQFADFLAVINTKNPKTNIFDQNSVFDLVTLRPAALRFVLNFFTDFGLPKGWRYTDYFPIHTYELNNKHGERYYAKFNWRTEQGFEFLTSEQVTRLNDNDYFIRDMYNAVYNGTYPSWRLDMDILSLHDIQNVDYDPFNILTLWKNGTYHTQTVGRLVMNKLPDNQFRDSEQAAFNPANLVPGIPGPVDNTFRGRRYAYRDAQNYRLGHNHNKISVNAPVYKNWYLRDGAPPVLDNGRDAPNYFPNTLSGPLPYVDDRRPAEILQILETNAIDLQPVADLYNISLDDAGKERMAVNIAAALSSCIESVQIRFIKLLHLVSYDLAARSEAALRIAMRAANKGPA